MSHHPRRPSRKDQVSTAGAPPRRLSSVEVVAIDFLSETINLDAFQNSVVRGEVRALNRQRWPLMLTKDQVCEYLGVSWKTLAGILTVSPVDLGASVVRYNRTQIDEWAQARPGRGNTSLVSAADGADPASKMRNAAVERARKRTSKR